MNNKTKSLIEALTSNIKKNPQLETMEKVNAGLIKTSNRKFMGKPKNDVYKNQPRTNKRDNYYIKSQNPNKTDFTK